MKSIRILALGTTLAASAILIQLPASPDNSHEPRPRGQATADDLAQAAADLSLSVEAVQEYTEGQEEFAELAARIQESWPDHFVDARWDGPTSKDTSIKVHKGTYSSARKLAGTQAHYIEVSESLSANERSELEVNLIDQVASLTSGSMGVSANLDRETLKATVIVTADADQTITRPLESEIVLPTGVTSVSIEYSTEEAALEHGSDVNAP